MKKNAWWVCFDHINYFSASSLNKLLAKTGFQLLYSTITFPMELFILMGEDYIGNPDVGSKMHDKRVILEHNLNKSERGRILKEELYQKFKGLGVGRTIICYAKNVVKKKKTRSNNGVR